MGCLDVTLDSGQMAALDEVSRVDLGFPMEFPGARGDPQCSFRRHPRDLIDNHRKHITRWRDNADESIDNPVVNSACLFGFGQRLFVR